MCNKIFAPWKKNATEMSIKISCEHCYIYIKVHRTVGKNTNTLSFDRKEIGEHWGSNGNTTQKISGPVRCSRFGVKILSSHGKLLNPRL